METTTEEEKTKENGDDVADAETPKELKETPSKSKAKRGVKARTGKMWLRLFCLRGGFTLE